MSSNRSVILYANKVYLYCWVALMVDGWIFIGRLVVLLLSWQLDVLLIGRLLKSLLLVARVLMGVIVDRVVEALGRLPNEDFLLPSDAHKVGEEDER